MSYQCPLCKTELEEPIGYVDRERNVYVVPQPEPEKKEIEPQNQYKDN